MGNSAIDRRDFFRALTAASVGTTFAWSGWGQTPAKPLIQVAKMSDRFAVMIGDGGNVGVVIGGDGLMMIDGGYVNRAGELQKSIAQNVDSHKVQILFDTHWHPDHVGSNEMLGGQGVKIMSHINTQKRLGMKIYLEALDMRIDPLKPEGIPKETFSGGGKMTFGTEKIEYKHFPQAHTDGDAWLFFPDPNIIQTGDLFFSGTYPVIDYSTGGWIGGMASALDTLLKVGDAQTRIVPGHGPMSTKADMQATRDMLHTVNDKLEALSKQHKSTPEVVALHPTMEFDATFGKGSLSPDVFVKIAYTSIGRHSSRAGQAA